MKYKGAITRRLTDTVPEGTKFNIYRVAKISSLK